MNQDIYVGSDFTDKYYHKGQSGVVKLLMEKQGFIKGAFHRDDIGDIDLLWGNENYGLCHILKRRTEQFGEQKALKFISFLEKNIKHGVLIEARQDRIGIITNKSTIILEKSSDNHFVLTAFIDKRNTLRLENLQTIHDVNFIDESTSTLNKGFDILSSNQSYVPIISKNPKHDSLNNENSNQTPNQSDDKSNSQADNKKQVLQYLRDNKPNINLKESNRSSKDKSSKESSNQSSKLLDPNHNKSKNKPKSRKQRK